MKNFSDFDIEVELPAFTGDKIKIERILNREITVEAYRESKSKFDGQCLCLQLLVGQEKRILFTGSTVLLSQVQKIPKDGFPFTTTIIKENERYQFT